jgi:hypothetical protein
MSAAPLGLLAELTHRCPLHCPYCSNPLDLVRRSAELDTATWQRIFAEAACALSPHHHMMLAAVEAAGASDDFNPRGIGRA